MEYNRYRKKPVVIEAVQWLPCKDQRPGGKLEMPIPLVPDEFLIEKRGKWGIKTLEGTHWLTPYDFIIRGVKGEYYPCKPDIFEMTYEKIGPRRREWPI